MHDNNEMRVKRNDAAVWRVIDGEVVILTPAGASINALTGCGSRIWELIEKEMTIPEIVDQICTEFEVEPPQATKDITEFINTLADMQLLENPVFEGVSH